MTFGCLAVHLDFDESDSETFRVELPPESNVEVEFFSFCHCVPFIHHYSSIDSSSSG